MICNFSHLHCSWTQITSQNICSMACWLAYHSHSLQVKYSFIPLSAWITFFKSALYQARFWSWGQWCQLKWVYWFQQIYSKHAGCCRSEFGLLLSLHSPWLPPHGKHSGGFYANSNESYQSDLLQVLIVQLCQNSTRWRSWQFILLQPEWKQMKLLTEIKYNLHWTKPQHLQGLSSACPSSSSTSSCAPWPVHPAMNPSAWETVPKHANSKQTDVSSLSPHFFPCGGCINAYWWLLWLAV